MSVVQSYACDRCGAVIPGDRTVIDLQALSHAIHSNPFGPLSWDVCTDCVGQVVACLVAPKQPLHGANASDVQ